MFAARKVRKEVRWTSQMLSALGHKQTFRGAIAMSALPPIATSIAFFDMSALGQKRTSAKSRFDPRARKRKTASTVGGL
jgi:hypothetical protein